MIGASFKLIRGILCICIVGLLTPSVSAQPTTQQATQASEPATHMSLPEGPLKVTIVALQGIVQARASSDQKWEKAAEGLELSEGAELRTGPRSAVKFMIGDDQTVSLDRLGTIQILRASFESGKVFTDLGMKYGRTRYDIESAARRTRPRCAAPARCWRCAGRSLR